MLEVVLERESLPAYHLTSRSTGEGLKFQMQDEETFKDDVTGQLRSPDLVRAARAEGLYGHRGRFNRTVGKHPGVSEMAKNFIRWLERTGWARAYDGCHVCCVIAVEHAIAVEVRFEARCTVECNPE